ncbi:MAG: hypothetical protein H0X30_00485 [Anaerolineae bacterium]|nr:hypothetical protein [Anaerolineae bacterium]
MTSEDEQKAIEKDYSRSWDEKEKRYLELSSEEGWEFIIPVCAMIKELRNQGYDRQLGVARYWHMFVLSRSRDRELRDAKAVLVFRFKKDGRMKIQFWDDEQKQIEFEVERVEITPEIEALLSRLLTQPVN